MSLQCEGSDTSPVIQQMKGRGQLFPWKTRLSGAWRPLSLRLSPHSLWKLSSYFYPFKFLSLPHYPLEICQRWRGCAPRLRVAEEHDTQSLKRGVIGPARSHSDNVSVSILPSRFTRAHADAHNHIPPFPESCQGWEGVFGERAAQENTTCSLKEKLLAWYAQAEENGENLCVPCASTGGKMRRQKRREGISERRMMEPHQRERGWSLSGLASLFRWLRSCHLYAPCVFR